VALPPIEAHLLCAGLVAVDLAARTARMRLLLQAFGSRVSSRRLLASALVGDAAAALTPFRAGGDVARVAAMRRAGVSVSRIVLALAAEAVQTWAVIAGGGAVLFWLYGGQAWESFAAGLRDMGQRVPPAAIAAIVLASGVLGAFFLRRLRALRPRSRRPPSPAPRPPVAKLLGTVPLTVVSIAA
jgi:uncharacterized membrane protein YbhN (UPF0104 family)